LAIQVSKIQSVLAGHIGIAICVAITVGVCISVITAEDLSIKVKTTFFDTYNIGMVLTVIVGNIFYTDISVACVLTEQCSFSTHRGY